MKQSFVVKNVFRAKWFANHHMCRIADLFMQINAVLCNCHIDYHADIKRDLSISHHGTGVVINSAAKIGSNVMVAHNVTIGNRMPNHPGAPTIGDNCYIGSGSYVGGGVKIGSNVKIGAMTVVIKDIPSNSTAVGNPARIIQHKQID